MADRDFDAVALISDLGARARIAASTMARIDRAQRSDALLACAESLRRASPHVLDANNHDVADARAAGMGAAMLDRLRLDAARLNATADSVAAIAALPDPVGACFDARVRPNGLRLERVRVPLGVIGIIYESRPDVTADAASLCLMAGNAVILRGGSEASRTNAAIHAALIEGIAHAGLPADAVQLVATTSRAVVGAMLGAQGLIDVIVPRGGKSLVARVQAEARVPVLAHLEGVNHVYVHAAADPATARAIVVNAKMRRTGVCGAMETLLIDRAFPGPGALVAALIAAGCKVRGAADVRALDDRVHAATDADWDAEYLDAICAVAIVDGFDQAIAHIARHGTQHTEAIVTEDASVAEQFLRHVDAAIVMWNASTQFADGGEFGLGAEIGIATGRLHARGPVALEGLTTYKWIVRGTGQVRD